ncbi:MAG: RdgB/HAM1 family non-canonical purine NTP pyrophosphatase [Candidatus Omnitrophota bacterium]
MAEILIATYNVKKRKELEQFLKEFEGVEVKTLADLETDPPIIVEDGKTFRQNAVKKAVTVSRFFKGLVLADDSGLEVEALQGKPGVRSARFARKNATDTENSKKLLRLLNKVPEKNRRARFVCLIALAQAGMLLDTFEGEIKGEIVSKQRGKNGFGYDSLFRPASREETFAEMAPSDKNQISHRAQALKKVKESIHKYL